MDKIRTFSPRHIAAAAFEIDFVKLSHTLSSFNIIVRITYGLIKGYMEEFQPLLESCASKTNWIDAIEETLFDHLLFSSLIDPLTALMKIRNGELITNPHAYELFRNLYNELYLAFPEIESLQPIEKVAAFCAAEPERVSAM